MKCPRCGEDKLGLLKDVKLPPGYDPKLKAFVCNHCSHTFWAIKEWKVFGINQEKMV